MTSTGYVRKYAVWVLNHAEEVLQTADAPRQGYEPEVQQALVLAWETLNRICAKRLIPFLPDIIESLEQCGHLQLSEERRRILLSMSAATADRLLRSQRRHCLRSLSTTKARPLLKQHIPIRTFEDWNEVKPGFLEVDLVAHCGSHLEGNFLYTLTLTDVATGWTECLPLLNRGREEVLAALQRARTLFPFPILGIDTDNGGEFINEDVATYCSREQITFTRGRPYEKRDQCFIEQKNGVVVRQVVGRDRFEGEHAARQLSELYRALRLYVNCFQPSMKLQSKAYEGRKVRRVYDPARTPLQRLLLSGVLPASQQHELRAVAKALDPLRLFQQLRHLQQAVFRYAAGCFPTSQTTPSSPLLVFAAERCTTGFLLPKGTEPDAEGSSPQHGCQKSAESISVLNWRRTCKDPFVGQWEKILSWMQADPTRTSGDIFRELQAVFPGRYQPLQVRTLQRGMSKIRAHLLTLREEPWQQELIHGKIPATSSQRKEPSVEHDASPPLLLQPADSSLGTTSARSCPPHPPAEAPLVYAQGRAIRSTTHASTSSGRKNNRPCHTSLPPARGESDVPDPGKDHRLTIEQAITSYIAHHHSAGHEAKTLQWHQTALGQFREYLLVERHLLHVRQITEADLQGWFAFLAQTPTEAGKPRAASTIETYARSARAFCTWLVQRGNLSCSPVSEESFPRASVPLPSLVQPDVFEQVIQAAFPQDGSSRAKKTVDRDRAILRVLFDTGISVKEVCSLRANDVDRKTGMVRVRGRRGRERQVALGAICQQHLFAFLDHSCTKKGKCGSGRDARDHLLFCTERGRPLTGNSLTLLFRRLRTRAGMRDIPLSPQILRHSFAFRYLQAGGDPYGLQELLGYAEMTPVKQYLSWYEQLTKQNRREREMIRETPFSCNFSIHGREAGHVSCTRSDGRHRSGQREASL